MRELRRTRIPDPEGRALAQLELARYEYEKEMDRLKEWSPSFGYIRLNSEAHVVIRQLNEYYDPERSHDDGGYDQQHIRVRFPDGAELHIEDTSCGDFGSRVFAELWRPDGTRHLCCMGSMIPEWDQYSTFERSDLPYLIGARYTWSYRLPLRWEL